jgi:lysyl-tRNA synthetase class 2
LARARAQRGLRAWLSRHRFLEADVAALQVSPGNETHIHALAVDLQGSDGASARRYLHTSPEFALKKLLAAGEKRLAYFGPVWRGRERGARHAPEFTMLEWYRVGAPYTKLMADAQAFAQITAKAAGSALLRHGGAVCDPFALPERLSVAEAFQRYAGVDLLATLSPTGAPDTPALAAQMRAAGLAAHPGDAWSDLFAKILVAKVEPALGQGRLTFLDHYPLCEAALARPLARDPRLSERFEMYACGVELANGFGELTDPGEQRRRFTAEMEEKARLYGERYPLDEDFLSALALMPPSAGCALGFDRLVMLATGAPQIDWVRWAPAP